MQPDLVILPMTGGHGPGAGSEAARLLTSAGIAVIHVDFSQHPVKNTQFSMRILGQAIGKTAEAERFNHYYQQKMDDVIARIPVNIPADKKPVIFVDYLPGLQECCGSPGKGSLTDMINLAGGTAIGETIIPGAIGKLNPEYILTRTWPLKKGISSILGTWTPSSSSKYVYSSHTSSFRRCLATTSSAFSGFIFV